MDEFKIVCVRYEKVMGWLRPVLVIESAGEEHRFVLTEINADGSEESYRMSPEMKEQLARGGGSASLKGRV